MSATLDSDDGDEDTSWGCGEGYPGKAQEGPEARMAREQAERERVAAAERIRQDAALLKLWRSLGIWDRWRILPPYHGGMSYPHRRF